MVNIGNLSNQLLGIKLAGTLDGIIGILISTLCSVNLKEVERLGRPATIATLVLGGTVN